MENNFKMRKRRNKKLSIARKLPPSYHKLPNQKFDVFKSEALSWLIKQPEILSFLWDQFKQSGDMQYDQETGVWTGADFDDN